MLRIFKITIAIFIIGLMLDVSSCAKCDRFPDRYKLEQLLVQSYAIDMSTGTLNKLYPLNYNSIVSSDSLGIVLYFNSISYYSTIRMDWGNVAYACSNTDAITEERIKDIKVVADREYDAQHPAGTNLADILEIEMLDDPITAGRVYNLADYVANEPPTPYGEASIRLTSPPDEPGEITFYVDFTQDGVDYNSFRGSTPDIYVY